MSPDALLADLRTQLGAVHVLSHNQPGTDLSTFESDWRGRQSGRAWAVALPSNTEEVAAVVRSCRAAGVAIVPQGGNTGLVQGGIPDASGTQLLLSLRRLQQVRSLDRDNLTLTVDAGCVLQTAQQAAEAAGLWLPLSLGSEGSCTVGGNLATNAGGTQVLRFGNARELCLGLEVVTPSGDIWHGLSGLRKDNTGYDLRHLFIGSEGTLGVITGATLRLFPQPAAQLTAWVAVPSVAAAVALLGLAQQQLGPALTTFELMGQQALSLVHTHFAQLTLPLWPLSPWYVLLENSDCENEAHARHGLEQLLAMAMDRGLAQDAVVADSLAQAQRLWQLRESIPLAQAQDGPNIKHDISLPVSRLAAFCEQADAALAKAFDGVQAINYGHLGDGNLHYNVPAPAGQNQAHFLREHEAHVHALVYDTVHRLGGSISAEHGIGSQKRAAMAHYKDPTALQLMHSIKQALDPLHLMNPGRVLS